MASFFQPAVYDPSAEASAISAAQSQSRFQVYSNSTLAGTGLLTRWYQYLVLALGAAALGVPLCKWVIGGTIRGLLLRRRQKRARLKAFGPVDPTESEAPIFLPSSIWKGEAIRSAHSFGFYLRDSLEDFLSLNYDLHIVDLDTYVRATPNTTTTEELEGEDIGALGRPVPLARTTSRNVWGLIEELEWSAISSNHISVKQTVDHLKNMLRSQGFSGFVISSGIAKGKKVNEILLLLQEDAVPCMLLDDAEAPCNEIDPIAVRGVIYRNACILTNGSRRDFFQASNLRQSLARYEHARKASPDFFLGFLDLWATSPLPSVIRRSYKFAGFHGAVYHHEAAGLIDEEIYPSGFTNPSSAFDWLKRGDIIKVCT